MAAPCYGGPFAMAAPCYGGPLPGKLSLILFLITGQNFVETHNIKNAEL